MGFDVVRAKGSDSRLVGMLDGFVCTSYRGLSAAQQSGQPSTKAAVKCRDREAVQAMPPFLATVVEAQCGPPVCAAEAAWVVESGGADSILLGRWGTGSASRRGTGQKDTSEGTLIERSKGGMTKCP